MAVVTAVLPGDIWRELDPRVDSRQVTVDRVDARFAYATSNRGRASRIQLTQFHNDSSLRRGYVLLMRAKSAVEQTHDPRD